MITENQVEELAIDWLKELGFDYLHGSEIERDYNEVLLEDRLKNALININNLPIEAIDEAIVALKKQNFSSLIQNNREFHKKLIDGILVEKVENDEKSIEIVKLIDFENPQANDFLVVNQFTVIGKKNHRPDIVVFINGMPLFVMELKNPADEDATIFEAYNQLQTYKNNIEDLFIYNEALIISDGVTAKIGSLNANFERFMYWKYVDDEKEAPFSYQLETLIRGFFKKEYLTNYIQNFITFEDDEKEIIKKIAGYHQFHAVRRAIESIKSAKNKKAGIIWHTQGSGKSLSMVFLTGKIVQDKDLKNPTIVVITDRNDLDDQLLNTFSKSHELLKQKPIQIESIDDLRETLKNRSSGGIIFTTIQKFALKDDEGEFPSLTLRENIIVIADEAHRSHYGFEAVLRGENYKYGYAKYLRDALPNATFIGFTGTPIESEDKDTRRVFGDYISIYDIEDAVKDGATVPIYYESRLAKLNLDNLKEVDEEVENLIKDEDIQYKEKIKREWASLEKLVGAKDRLSTIAKDIVEHFENRLSVIDGKGMIVAISREVAVDLYNEIIKFRPSWHNDDPMKGFIKVIMTGSASDDEKLQKHIYSKKIKKEIEKRFKNIDDELKLVIVVDMWLTGFDVPSLHTMYIDKPMRGHNLMQAIARVNRVFKGKSGGLIVDYIGIANELKNALRVYTSSGGKGKTATPSEEMYHEMLKRIDIIRGMFHGFDYSEYKTNPHKLLAPATNHILGLEDGKKRFCDEVVALTKAYSLCSTLEKALKYKEEVAFFQAVKSILIKSHSNKERRTNKSIKHIIDNSIKVEGIEDIFDLVGLDKPNISILSDEFLEEVSQMKYKNLAVELLERLLKNEIKSKSKTSIVREQKFSEKLQTILNRYHNRTIETAQVIEELIAMAKDFRAELQKGKGLGLNDDEIAFYEALALNESAVRELGDETLKKIAIELTETLRKNVTIDWKYRENIRAKIKNRIRVLLRRYKYPPDKTPQAIETVLKQAERISDEWSN
ncbi:type I restriction endonuclease subunit R [Hydrogenimonas thermophila]|uniref:Type I restriction enzyme endonuclease subunit n=1 Tax=Hydrogenimonas thermophila TaxID=223786 RepID=A0A1I5SUE0_9BACT|nr:type I restriction endonuclease subunit R [Hydrogenimonas thermophila]SFP74380.1 type I restriction enzyme, R subunit [Hydrogenimonas thermophila]